MGKVSENDSQIKAKTDSAKSRDTILPRPDLFAAWDRSSYWLTRFAILRLLGFVYFVAFLAAANQIVPLVGEHGLLPARDFLEHVAAHFGSRADGFLQLPSLFWFDVSDAFLNTTAWLGVGLSLVVLFGYANAIMMAVLWGLYFSFIDIGQDW